MTVESGIEWLICREPVHIGGADSSSRGNNNPIFRLPDRTPAIPGSSLRGALREHAEQDNSYKDLVKIWFGGQNQELSKDENDKISPGGIAVSWGWPVWWPVHVLGYGNWWISCPAWLQRFQNLAGSEESINLDNQKVYITDEILKDEKSLYLRWLQLKNIEYYDAVLPAPIEVITDRCIIVPNDSINLIVDMGLVRQPRVSLKDKPDEKDGSLVGNLFAVEGFPPGAVFAINWMVRANKVEELNLNDWKSFLRSEHYLGGLWSVGYGRISIEEYQKQSQEVGA